MKIIRGLTKAPVLVVDRQYDSTEKTAAVKAGVINTLSGQKVITFPRCDLLISFR